MKTAPLTCTVSNGVLTISIGVETLAHAATIGPFQEDDSATGGTSPAWRVTDLDGFAKDVIVAMTDEDGAGNTLLSEFLDGAMREAMENGGEAIVPADCNCTPADNTGGGHSPTCPVFEPECTCCELTGGHQPGCYFNRSPRSEGQQ